jgi:hypothetical protein
MTTTSNAGNGDGAKPTHGQIAALAYNLYKDRGRQPGHEKDDWYYAEQLLTGQINLETAARLTVDDEARGKSQHTPKLPNPVESGCPGRAAAGNPG